MRLFDVFGSWWFGVVVVLLFTSLTACLVPRQRVFWRNVRKPPVTGATSTGSRTRSSPSS